MNLLLRDPPREFEPRPGGATLRDCGCVRLEPGEQVTFRTAAGSAYDVVRTTWGFYATGSLNRRLPRHGLRPVLVANEEGARYLLLVEAGREPAFEAYLAAERLRIVAWLDDSGSIASPPAGPTP